MSELVVQATKIEAIKPHPYADRLEIATIGGWDVIVGKNAHKAGDIVVHIQPDSMVPALWAERWGVTPYLTWKKNATYGRVRAARIRGIPSFGFTAPNCTNAPLGQDLSGYYDIQKYEPPPPPVGMQAGQMRNENPLFHRYTDIQNLRNHKDHFCYGEPIVITEKIHGTNSRVGWVRNKDTDMHEFVVGTHKTQRDYKDCGIYGLPAEKYGANLAELFDWFIENTEEQINSVIVFGEIFGAGVQDLHYGAKLEKDYRIFDIALNGEYINWRSLEYLCTMFGLPTVPVITMGVFDFEQLLEEAQGSTKLNDDHIREGIVVRPMVQELTWQKGELDPNPNRRMIFKVISSDYLTRKDGTEYH